MAHSHIDFRGHYVHLNDSVIISIVYPFIIEYERLKRDQESDALLDEMVQDWKHNLSYSVGAGCIDLYLDKHLQDDAHIDAFLRVLDSVEVRFRSFGEAVPSTFFDEMFQTGWVRFSEQSVDDLVERINTFRGLIRSDPLITKEYSKP